MDIDVLKTFIAVAESGGFAKAEARVHRTQSTISQQIARLERELGVALFDRRARGARLSGPGQRYLGYARRIVALDTEARSVVGRDGATVIVRLGVAEDFAAVHLPEFLGRFAAANPTVRLEVLSAPSRAVQDDLLNGRIDLSITHELDPPRDALASHAEKLAWVGKRSAWEEPVPLVVYPQGCAYRNRAISTLEAAGMDWRIAYEIPHLLGIRSALENGLGVSVLERRSFVDRRGLHDLADDAALPALDDAFLTLRARETPCRGIYKTMADAIVRDIFPPAEGADVALFHYGVP